MSTYYTQNSQIDTKCQCASCTDSERMGVMLYDFLNRKNQQGFELEDCKSICREVHHEGIPYIQSQWNVFLGLSQMLTFTGSGWNIESFANIYRKALAIYNVWFSANQIISLVGSKQHPTLFGDGVNKEISNNVLQFVEKLEPCAFVAEALKNSNSAKTVVNSIIDTVINLRTPLLYCEEQLSLLTVIQGLNVGLMDGKVVPIELGIRPTKWKRHSGIVITCFRNWCAIKPIIDALLAKEMKVRVEQNDQILKEIPRGYTLYSRWYFRTHLLLKNPE